MSASTLLRVCGLPLLIVLVSVLLSSPISAQPPVTNVYTTFSSAPQVLYTWDTNAASIQNAPTGSGSFQRQGGNAGHYGVAYFRGGAVAPTYQTGTSLINLTVNAGDYLNLGVYPDSQGRLFPSTIGGSMSFEFWAKFAEFRPWSRLMDFGSCGGCDNLVMAQNGKDGDNNSPHFSFHSVNGGTPTAPNTVAGPGNVTDADYGVNGPLRQDEWMHIVCIAAQRFANDSTSYLAADFSCYFNGQPGNVNSFNYANPPYYTGYTMPGSLPNTVVRNSLLLGESNYNGGNYNFNGWMDMFAFYNYPLPVEAIAAHSVVQRPPIFEFVAASDPHTISGVDTAATGYSWMAQDPTEAASTFHKGVVQLSSVSSQWLNLATTSGANSIGQSFSKVIGDAQSYPYFGQQNGGNAVNSSGYTFEVTIKFSAPAGASSSKVFELGNGANVQDVSLSLVTTSSTAGQVTFNVYRSDMSATSALTVVSAVQFGVWYHIAVVLAPAGGGRATVTPYVNGVAQTVGTTLFPEAVARTHAQLGKSDVTGDAYLSAFIDSFRIFDYNMPAAFVQALYNVTSQGLPPSTAVVIPPPTQYTSGPQVAYTFDTAPPANLNDADSNYTWVASMTALNSPTTSTQSVTRGGVATLNGVFQLGDYVDLTVDPDSYGNTLTFPFGGAVSIEMSYMYSANAFTGVVGNGYQYIFATSGELGQGNNNWGWTSVATAATSMLSAWFNTSSTNSHITDSYTTPGKVIAYPGRWQHVIVSCQPLSFNNFGTLGSNYTIYYNGQPIWSQLGPTPAWVVRSQAFIGKSSDDANSRANVAVDAFYMYNYALSAEAAALHYAVPRAPRFELCFDQNPLTVTNISSSIYYSWQSAVSSHPGVLQLSATAGPGWGSAASTGQWVNLAIQAGLGSVGTSLPLLGGPGIGLTNGAQLGWTVELTFQVTSSSTTPNMVLLDISGATVAQDEFMLSFAPNSCALQVSSYGGSAGTALTSFTAIPCVTTGRWYHLVVSMTHSTISPTRATFRSFVNGQLTNVVLGAALRSTARVNAFLGRSLAEASATTATLPFNGLIDAFRIYDFAAVQDDVSSMFSVTSSDAPAIAPMAIYSSAPQNQWTFDAPSSASNLLNGSFVYEAGRGSHFGLAYFRGSGTPVNTTNNVVNFGVNSGDYLNLVNYPDAKGKSLPLVWGGGPATFEVWAEWEEYQVWSRLLDWGGCAGCDNLVLTQNGQPGADSTILSFHSTNGGTPTAPFTTAGPGQVTDCDVLNALTLNSWLHVVCTIRPRDPNELASVQAADYACWINGVPQVVYSYNYANPALWTTYTTPGAMPNAVARQFGLLGQSNFNGNYNFNGAVDAVYWYNAGMTTEAVQWHFTAPRPAAVMEVTASPDPRLTAGTMKTATYGWLASDSSDSPAMQALHTGLISLSGGQYVDMTVGSGAASLGQALSMQLGDGQAYTGLVLNSTAVGYSFEVVIKFPSLPTASGKVFELGNGYQMDEVVLNYNFASTSITFNSYRSSFTTPADIPVVTGVQAGVWYHLMVTLTQGTSTTAASSTATAYVNGVRQGSAVTNAVYPANVARTHAWLGRSDWTGEQPITALIDSFRIYDYVMPATSVQALFNLSSTGLPGTPPVVPTSFYQYQSGPQLSYTLDTAPPADQLSYNSNYSWTASSTVYPNPDGSTTPHSGVGVFNGLYPSGNSIDITALPDSQGRTFNFPIGGSMSFESWFLYYAPLRTSQPGAPSSVNGYDYIFNLGGVIGYPSNNLGLTTLGWGNAMFFAIFLNATSQHIVDTSGTIIVSTPGKWQHFILSVQQLSPSVTYGSAAANCTVYISGKAAWSQLCNVPQWVARPNGYLGRSPDDNNVRHLGEIDSWYLYNYALSAEAAAMHYVLPRAAIMEIVFDRDPQLVTNTQTSGYTWMASQGGHSGVLSLSGAATQFVDLSAYTGTNSIGTTLPSLPLSAGGAGITQTAYGWTLEVNLQLTTASTNPGMVVLDIGSSTAGTDELLLQFTPGQCSLQLVVYGGSAGTTAVTVPITGCITASTWYSVIVTASVASPTASTATYQAYLNGYAAGTAVSGAVIRSGVRPVGYIGKSIGASSASAGTLPFQGLIDSVRLMDFAATATQVASIALVANPGGAPPTSGSSTGTASPAQRSSSAAVNGQSSQSGQSTAAATSTPLPPLPGQTSSPYSPPSSSSSSSSLSSGAIAGIVIGAVVGALILVCILWFLLCGAACRTGKSKSTEVEETNSHRHDEFVDQSTHRNDEAVEMQETA